MKTNRNVFLLAFVAFVLSLILTSCAGAEHETTAEVRVVGSRASSSSASVQSTTSRSSSDQFESAKIVVDGKNITNDLKPVTDDPDYQANSPNDTLFGADVPVLGNTVSYSVEPRPGFVFDEWEFSRDARSRIRREHGQNWMNVMREIMMEIAGDPETIEINPDYIKYIRPTFDRGAYFDASHNTVHDENTHIGTKSNPISNIDDLISFIKKYSSGGFDDDELTIKFTSEAVVSLDFSQIHSGTEHRYWEDERELELKLIGGYDSEWNVIGKTEIKEIKLPDFSHWFDKDLEIEIEFRNIAFTELDYSNLLGSYGDDDREFEFRNCSVGTLSNAGRIINGLIIDEMIADSVNTTFINSVVPYDANDTYIHSIITRYSGGEINGVNNIVVYSADNVVEKQADDNNYYISRDEYDTSFRLNGYKTSDPSLIDELTTAAALNEDAFDDDHSWHGIEIDDDMIEEDIVGRERYLIDDDGRYWDIPTVSYGPYEYKWFDD